MSTTPIGRDFKRAGRSGSTEFRFSRDFFIGLAVGLIIAGGVYLWQQQVIREVSAVREADRPTPRAIRRDAAAAEAEEQPKEYGFYDMLPKSEVVVPEVDPKAPAPSLPTTPIDRPGVYVLQLGVFRNLEDADRLQAKLLRLGVRSTVQRVAIDNDVFHRVRIGPVSDLDELNRTRASLRRAEMDVVVIRVGD